MMPVLAPGAPQDEREPLPGSTTPAEPPASPDEPEIANGEPSRLDPLREYRWRERGLGVASPLTWKQRRKMRWLITTGRAEPLPIEQQTHWISADMRYLLAGATRVIVKPDGKMVLR